MQVPVLALICRLVHAWGYLNSIPRCCRSSCSQTPFQSTFLTFGVEIMALERGIHFSDVHSLFWYPIKWWTRKSYIHSVVTKSTWFCFDFRIASNKFVHFAWCFESHSVNNIVYWQCAVNFSSDSIPNGLGFGGRVNHFGLFLSASFDQGQTFPCTTFGSPSLSKTTQIRPEVIECWGIVPKGGQQESRENVKGTVLERFKEDRHMLNMVGLANSSE